MSKLGGKEDGVGVDVGHKEEQELDDWQQQPGSVEPKDAWLEPVDIATSCCVTHNPDQLGVDDGQQQAGDNDESPNAPACKQTGIIGHC